MQLHRFPQTARPHPQAFFALMIAVGVVTACGPQDLSTGPRHFSTAVRATLVAPAPVSSWQQLAPTGATPSGRYVHSNTAYDEANDRLILFGGYDGNNDLRTDSRVWVLSNATGLQGPPVWTELSPAAPPRGRVAFTTVYDPSSNRLIVHGGCGGFCSPALHDTWVLTNANGLGGTPEWLELPSAPVGRVGHAAVYDAGTNRMVVFGGATGFFGTSRNDVWVLTDANGLGEPEWIELTPSGTAPTSREAAHVFFDPSTNRMLLFGGDHFTSAVTGFSLNDYWALDHATGVSGAPQWTLLATSGTAPAPRGAGVIAYDRARNRAIVFGGLRHMPAPAENYGDAWRLENANGVAGTPEWHALSPTGAVPSPRYRHLAAYAPAAGALITGFGASQLSLENDIWLLRIHDVLDLDIDVKPGDGQNTINPRSNGITTVAILDTPALAIARVDVGTVRFGATGGEAPAVNSRLEDANGDGATDLVLQFRTDRTGLTCGASVAKLTGKTEDGIALRGTDAIRTVGCQ